MKIQNCQGILKISMSKPKVKDNWQMFVISKKKSRALGTKSIGYPKD
jgi:hypothetical protein